MPKTRERPVSVVMPPGLAGRAPRADSGTLDPMTRGASVMIRLTEDERAAWQAAADADHRKLADWVRLQCNAVAMPAKPKRKAR